MPHPSGNRMYRWAASNHFARTQSASVRKVARGTNRKHSEVNHRLQPQQQDDKAAFAKIVVRLRAASGIASSPYDEPAWGFSASPPLSRSWRPKRFVRS